MGAFTYEMPTEEEMAAQGSYLKTPGRYLLHITDMDEQPATKEGKAISGFKADASVVGSDHAGKKVDILIRSPNSSHKDGGKFGRRVQASFFIAAGLITHEQLGKSVTIELQDATNRMVVADLDFEKNEDGTLKKYLGLSYANIWHIDDPHVADFMKAHQKDIAVLPKEHRRDPASFKTASTNGNGSTPAPQSQPAADDDLGDL